VTYQPGWSDTGTTDSPIPAIGSALVKMAASLVDGGAWEFE